ncbi:PIN domain-like protein, partial [Eremomyces bilateralis CBS 781.70]
MGVQGERSHFRWASASYLRISGLLSYLEDISKPVSLKNFAGQTIGVDGYGWLHRGAVSCAIELAQGKPTNRYVDFFMGRVRMLEHFGIKPYIVLDGDYLPSKAGTELQRSSSRESSKKIGLELLKVGRSAQAFQTLQKAVEVTPEMARLVIDELRRCGVSYVVAPYEADSQLVYLEKKGLISAILSEDSDMLVFGAKVLLTKLDKFGGTIMIRREKFTACRRLSFAGWTDNEFRRMCILSGCDYLANMKNMGLKNAHAMVRKHKSIDRIIRAIQFDGKFKVPPGYLKLFDQAEKTFLYQRVFDPKTKQLVTLNDPTPDFADEMEGLLYIGPKIDNETAAGIALGELHPHNKGELKPAPAPVKPLQRFNTPKLRTDSGPPGGDPPITDFFAKKRIPLAELDPNTFAPTPEQEALLARARNSEWNGYEAPVISSNSLRTRSAPIVVHPSQENIDPNVSSRRTASAPLSIAR